MVIQLFLIVLALLITFFILKRAKRKRAAFGDNGAYQVKFDDEKIKVIHPNGSRSQLLWADISSIAIMTTDEGPQNPDVFWLFYASSPKPALVFPQEAIGDQDLFNYMLKRFPDLDHQLVIDAMGCTDNATFVIWDKKNNSHK